MARIKLDEQIYEVDTLSERSENLLSNLRKLDEQLTEKQNVIAILTKAKRAYINELKAEMLMSKSGIDFNED